jgi:hypothetical protein
MPPPSHGRTVTPSPQPLGKQTGDTQPVEAALLCADRVVEPHGAAAADHLGGGGVVRRAEVVGARDPVVTERVVRLVGAEEGGHALADVVGALDVVVAEAGVGLGERALAIGLARGHATVPRRTGVAAPAVRDVDAAAVEAAADEAAVVGADERFATLAAVVHAQQAAAGGLRAAVVAPVTGVHGGTTHVRGADAVVGAAVVDRREDAAQLRVTRVVGARDVVGAVHDGVRPDALTVHAGLAAVADVAVLALVIDDALDDVAVLLATVLLARSRVDAVVARLGVQDEPTAAGRHGTHERGNPQVRKVFHSAFHDAPSQGGAK